MILYMYTLKKKKKKIKISGGWDDLLQGVANWKQRIVIEHEFTGVSQKSLATRARVL